MAASAPSSKSSPSFPLKPQRMAASVKSIFWKLKPSADLSGTGFGKAPKGQLFPQTDPNVDGEDCLHDCASCTVRLPSKFSINEDDPLYGFVNGWSTHLIVATGKTDWVRDVADEKGSVMEAVDKGKAKPTNGKLMLSASNMPLPLCPADDSAAAEADLPTTVLLLPAFLLIDNVRPSTVPQLVTEYINNAPTNTTPLSEPMKLPDAAPNALTPVRSGQQLTSRSCPHNYLILLCSQKTRDARCGQSAPLLRKELERHLRPLGLYRDLHDERPGGVGIYFISHVGGHKYSANMMIYRRVGAAGVVGGEGPKVLSENGTTEKAENGEELREAAQCIWLARVRPEDCENVIKYTVLQGKVVKPDRQLRGGFDRGRQLVSW